MKIITLQQRRLHRTISFVGSVLMLLLLVGSYWFPELISVGPVSIAAITGTMFTDGIIQNIGDSVHRKVSISDVLTRVDPSRFPFTTFMMQAGKGAKPKDILHRWGSISHLPRTDLINGVTTAGGANAAKSITVDNGSYWRVNDYFAAYENATDVNRIYLITAIATNALTVWALPVSTAAGAHAADNFGTVPVFADNEKLRWLGNTKEEQDAKSASRIIQPAYEFNYVHTFDHVVDWSDHKARSENYGPDDVARWNRDSLIEFRKSLEYSTLLNPAAPSVTQLSGGQMRWTMAGVRHYVTDAITLGSTTPTQAQMVDFVYSNFVDNNGSESKILFGGKDLMKAIDKSNLGDLFTRRSEKISGVQVNHIEGRMGRLSTVYHPGFDELDIPDEGLSLDMRFIELNDYQPLERRVIDLKRSGTAVDGDSVQYIVKLTATVRYGGTNGTQKRVSIV